MEDARNDELALLLERQNAIELMFVGLAIALHETGSVPLDRTVISIEFMRLFAQVTESQRLSERFDPTLERLRVARNDADRPRMSLSVLIAMHAATQPQLRDALRDWLNQATHTEIIDDISELFAKQSPPPADVG